MLFRTETLGCKVNQYETQAMEALLCSAGHAPAAAGEKCGLYIINTCAVTAESGRKSRQAIRRIRNENPDAVIGVCGCYSQISPDEVAKLDVDLVCGSGDRQDFIARLLKIAETHEREVFCDDPMKRRVMEQLPCGNMAGRTRAMLKLQDGCSNFCSYCIIPYSRGPVRSLPLDGVRADAALLAARGFRETVVTGIEIASYGKDLGGVTLIDAIEAISEAAPDVRIHLGSLEPRIITEEFCDRAKNIKNLCDHFHLSLQSGCDATLKRMRRRYDTARFYESVALLRKYYPMCGITTDLITGFPGETDAEFAETMAFIEKCAFSDMHIFPYSPRPGTPAVKMDGQVINAVKHARAAEATKLAAKMSGSFRASLIGTPLSVLFETESDGVCRGHSTNYVEVAVEGTGLHNIIADVTAEEVRGGLVFGTLRAK